MVVAMVVYGGDEGGMVVAMVVRWWEARVIYGGGKGGMVMARVIWWWRGWYGGGEGDMWWRGWYYMTFTPLIVAVL